MPTKLPPDRKRATPEPEEEESTAGDTLVPVMLIVTLLAVNVALYCWKFGPPASRAFAAAPQEMQMAP
jgi:hypothetical protein